MLLAQVLRKNPEDRMFTSITADVNIARSCFLPVQSAGSMPRHGARIAWLHAALHAS
jgi:hypothetical protein